MFVRKYTVSCRLTGLPSLLNRLDRFVFWVNEPLSELRGTYAHHYICWGSRQTFASKKSKAVPVPQRATCAGRPVWYDLTGLKPGVGFWPKAQQYRHIIPANPDELNCNCNLYDLHDLTFTSQAIRAFMPVLNCTLIALFKPFYGRYAGTEGNLKRKSWMRCFWKFRTRAELPTVLKRLEEAFFYAEARSRPIGGRSPDELSHRRSGPGSSHDAPQFAGRTQAGSTGAFWMMPCWRSWVVESPTRRQALLDQLYIEVTRFYRNIRIVEVQKMEQRRQGGTKDSVSALDLALDAFRELGPEW